MSSAVQINSNSFTTSCWERITSYVEAKSPARKKEIFPLTPDASTREYFRIPCGKGTAVAAVYPEPFDPTVHPYLDVTRLFLECGLPVLQVIDVDSAAGIIVQEDLGNRQLCQVFKEVS